MDNEDYVTYDPRIPRYKSILTKPLIIFILFMFFVEIFYNAMLSDKAIILLGAKWNYGITNGEYWRFLTCTFLHGNLLHLFLNLIALYIFGQEVESIFGWYKFILIYFFTSWGAGLASYTLSPHIAIGASGVAFGLIGCLITFFFKLRKKVTGANLRFKSMYTLVFINLVLGFIIPRIDNSAHIGGLITGLTLGWFTSPEYTIKKDDLFETLSVTRKTNFWNLSSGCILISTILFWLTRVAINFQKL